MGSKDLIIIYLNAEIAKQHHQSIVKLTSNFISRGLSVFLLIGISEHIVGLHVLYVMYFC